MENYTHWIQDEVVTAAEVFAPHSVCSNCGHAVTVAYPLDQCENCSAHATFIDYFIDPAEADDAAAMFNDDSTEAL